MMYYRGTGGLGHCFGDGFGYMQNFMHSGRGIFMMIGGLLIAALIIAAIVVLVKNARMKQAGSYSGGSIELLNERFVKGEITEEEYTKMLKVLKTK